jgi:hypothetical protein
MRKDLSAAVLSLGLLIGCGSDTETGTGDPNTGGTGGDGNAATGAPFDLTGTFAVEAVIKGQAIIEIDSIQYFLVTFDQNGTELDVTTRTCDIQLPSVPDAAEVFIPEKLRKVMREEVHQSKGEYLSATLGGAKYKPPAQVVVLGADLAQPKTDPLPTEEDLTNAVDQDEDGEPGVTLEADVALCSGIQELYIALRTVVTLDGTVEDSNTISGDMVADLEQSVLGMSDRCLNAATTLDVEVLPGSTFRALRIDGANDSVDLDSSGDGKVDCDELTAGLETVFE